MNDQARLEGINQNIQRLLAQSPLPYQNVKLLRRSDVELEIVVDGTSYSTLDEINDLALRDLIQTAIAEWQDEAVLTVTNHTPLPGWRPAPFKMARKWVISWLIVLILVFVIPGLFLTPPEMAVRLSFVCLGAIIGGFVGSWAGRQVGQQIGQKVNNPGCAMSGGIFGAFIGLILGLIFMAFVLNLLLPI